MARKLLALSADGDQLGRLLGELVGKGGSTNSSVEIWACSNRGDAQIISEHWMLRRLQCCPDRSAP